MQPLSESKNRTDRKNENLPTFTKNYSIGIQQFHRNSIDIEKMKTERNAIEKFELVVKKRE